MTESDAGKRAETYADSQRKVLQNGPFIVMFQQIEVWALRKNVNGFSTGAAVSSAFYWTVTK